MSDIYVKDVDGSFWVISKKNVLKDMHRWAAETEKSGSWGKCITRDDILQWVNDNLLAIEGWALVSRPVAVLSEPDGCAEWLDD